MAYENEMGSMAAEMEVVKARYRADKRSYMSTSNKG